MLLNRGKKMMSFVGVAGNLVESGTGDNNMVGVIANVTSARTSSNKGIDRQKDIIREINNLMNVG